MQGDKKIKVLFVDDEEHNLTSFKATFRRDYNLFLASDGPGGIEEFTKNQPDVVITDQRMPGMTGIEFLEKIQEINNAPMRMLLTGYSDINAVIDAINKGHVYRYMQKPWQREEIINAIESAYEVFALRKQNAQLLKDLDTANKQLEFLLRQKLLS